MCLEAHLVLWSIKSVILEFYDDWVVSKCWAQSWWACLCMWDISIFLEIATLQWLSNAVLPFCTPGHLHKASQGVFCNDLTHWSVLQHHWCRLEAITAVRFSQSTKINLKIFLEGIRISQLFRLFSHIWTNSYSYLIDCPNQSIKLSEGSPYLFLFYSSTQPLGRHIFLL